MRAKFLKRFMMATAMLLASVCGVNVIHAQGIATVGMAAGFATYNDGGYANVFLQIPVVQHVRVAPEIGYIFRNKGLSGFEASCDVQFPFLIARGFTIYPLMGLTYNYWKCQHSDASANRVGFDIGAGIDIMLAKNLKLIIQGKGSLMNDTGGGFFCAGIGYTFQ